MYIYLCICKVPLYIINEHSLVTKIFFRKKKNNRFTSVQLHSQNDFLTIVKTVLAIDHIHVFSSGVRYLCTGNVLACSYQVVVSGICVRV